MSLSIASSEQIEISQEIKTVNVSPKKNIFKRINEKVKNVATDIFRFIGDFSSSSSKIAKFCKFTARLLTAVSQAIGNPAAKLINTLNLTDNVIDVVGTASGLNDVINHKDNNSKLDKVAGRVGLVGLIALVAADIGAIFLWLDELAIISLATISSAIGKGLSKISGLLGSGFTKFTAHIATHYPKLMEIISKISLLKVVQSLVAVGFALLSVKSCIDLAKAIKAHDLHGSINQVIYLISYIAEVVLKIVVLAGCLSGTGAIVLGCVAAGIGLVAIGYEMFRKYKKEREEEQQKLNASQ